MQANLREWQRLKPLLPVYPIDADDADIAVDLQLSLRKSGWQLASFDALIAVTALRYGLILLTTDNDFRAVEGLQTENWLEDLR